MRRGLFILLTAIFLLPGAARAQQELVADLSEHLVAITTGFSGTDVLMFGATDGPGDVIMVVRGPPEDPVVRRKDNGAGIWVNQDYVTFKSAPSFYQVAATRPLEDFAPLSILERHQIGQNHLRLDVAEQTAGEERLESFRKALVRLKQKAGLFGTEVDNINILGNRLFRADLHFPANVPTGTYFVEIYLVRAGEVISAEITPLQISKVGVGADIYHFAYDYSAIYGIIAILVAVAAGWLAGVVFRKT